MSCLLPVTSSELGSLGARSSVFTPCEWRVGSPGDRPRRLRVSHPSSRRGWSGPPNPGTRPGPVFRRQSTSGERRPPEEEAAGDGGGRRAGGSRRFSACKWTEGGRGGSPGRSGQDDRVDRRSNERGVGRGGRGAGTVGGLRGGGCESLWETVKDQKVGGGVRGREAGYSCI